MSISTSFLARAAWARFSTTRGSRRLKRFRWIPAAWLLITLSMVVPHVPLALVEARVIGIVLAVLGGAAVFSALAFVVMRAAPTKNSGYVGLGIVAAIVIGTTFFATKSFQLAGRAGQTEPLDGVPMQQVLAHGRRATWVRITDARVRSEAVRTLRFVSGDAHRGSQTHTTVALAPVTLASEVTNEAPLSRAKVTGAQALWACAESSGMITTWDGERQAVRGELRPMDDLVRETLERELNPGAPPPSPGAGVIPAAPGASLPAAMRAGSESSLSVAPAAWCVELDWPLDAKAAKEGALAITLSLLFVLPLCCVAMLAIALSKTKKE